MLSFNDKISIRQLQILLILDIFGTGIITIPRRAAEYAKQDAWICVVIATVIAIVFTYIITTLGRMFSKHRFTEYSGMVLSKPIGVLLSIVFSAKLVLVIAMELRLFGEIMKQSMLTLTPFWVVCMAMILVAGYAAAKGYETRARIYEILIYIVFIPLIVIFALSFKETDLTNLLPFMVTEPKDLLFGGFTNTIAFTGIELCLLVPFYINKPQNLRKGACTAVLLVGLFMVITTILAIAQFGFSTVESQMWPLIEMIDTINLPGGFIERQDAIVMSFFIISVFAVVNAGLFFSSLLLKDVVRKGKHSTYILLCALAVFIVSMLPSNIVQVFEIMTTIHYFLSIPFMVIVPLVILVVAKMRGLGDKIG